MKLYIKQKVFSWKDRFSIYDENGDQRYDAEGKVFSLGKKLFLYNIADGSEIAYIHQKVWAMLPKFFISRGGTDVAKVTRKLTFAHPKYTVEGPGWDVNGDIWAHEYTINDGTRTVASIAKRWLSWGDTYEIDIADDADEILALCVVLVIDAVMMITTTTAAASVHTN